MQTVLVIIIVIVLVVVSYVGYMLMQKRRDNTLRERYHALLDESTGAYDQPACEAEFTIDAIDGKTAEDELHAGRITDLNRNLGDMQAATPLDQHTTIQHYTRALELVDADANTVNPVWTVDFIAGFIDRNADIMLANPIAAPLINTYNNVAPGVRKREMERAKALAAQDATTPADYAAKTLNHVKTHTSDPQNVHDSSVNTSLRKTVARIRDTTQIVPFDVCAAEASAWVSQCNDPVKRDRAERALALLENPSDNSTIGCTDTDVFSMVWSRTNIPANSQNANKMRDAIVDAIADFYEQRLEGISANPVCVNGRCGRMLESLVLLDHDDSLGGAQTLEQHRNDIMDQVKLVLDREIAAAKISGDANMRNVANSYEGSGDKVDPVAEKQFKDSVKREIDLIIDAKRDILGNACENIRTDAYAAID